MAFKLFKLLMVLRVFKSLTTLELWLKNVFIFQKIKIENIMNYVKTLIQLILLEHIFACVWIYINHSNEDWSQYDKVVIGSYTNVTSTDGLEEITTLVRDDFMFDSYGDSLYFITTTMTSVGYGDISGFG